MSKSLSAAALNITNHWCHVRSDEGWVTSFATHAISLSLRITTVVIAAIETLVSQIALQIFLTYTTLKGHVVNVNSNLCQWARSSSTSFYAALQPSKQPRKRIKEEAGYPPLRGLLSKTLAYANHHRTAIQAIAVLAFVATMHHYEGWQYLSHAARPHRPTIPAATPPAPTVHWLTKLPIPLSTLIAAGVIFMYPKKSCHATTLNVVGTVIETLTIRSLNLTQGAVPLRAKGMHCRKAIQWAIVNTSKQWLIKNCAFFIPFVIYCNYIRLAYKSDTSNNKTDTLKSIKKEWTLLNLSYYIVLAMTALANPNYEKIFRVFDKNFDCSGHIMLTTVIAHIIGQALAKHCQYSYNSSSLLGAAYIITDGIFLKNTAKCYHTALESIGGLIWGGAILTLGSRIHTFFSQPPPLAKKDQKQVS